MDNMSSVRTGRSIKPYSMSENLVKNEFSQRTATPNLTMRSKWTWTRKGMKSYTKDLT